MVKYKDYEIEISSCNYSDGSAYIPLPDSSVVCISKQDATAEELEIIALIKADVDGREPAPNVPIVTLETRVVTLEDENASLRKRLAQSEADNIVVLEAIAQLYEMTL